MKTFVMGDIHGAHRAMLQCFERSGFDYEKDELIMLGDVADGWPEVPECIEELLKIKNMIYIMGNHDVWLDKWFKMGESPIEWTEQGGQASKDAYIEHGDLMIKHFGFFDKANRYYVDDDNRVFTHGGFHRGINLASQSNETFTWNRSLAEKAVSGWGNPYFKIHEFKEVYLGHTTVNSFSSKRVPRNKPFISGNMILMDTGAGMEGVLTIMDVETKEYWQSDLVHTLYPNHKGRR